MRITRLVFFSLLLLQCQNEIVPGVNKSIEEISQQEKNIVIVDIDSISEQRMGTGETFRDNLVILVDEIKKSNPSSIFLSYIFGLKSKSDSDFAQNINKGIRTISRIEINKSEIEENFPEDIKKNDGLNVKWVYGYSSYDDQMTEFSGIRFPSDNIMKYSYALCTYVHYRNVDDDKVHYLFPYNKYKNYLFESCPITIVNNILSNYRMAVIFDRNDPRFKLYYRLEGPYVKFIKYLDKKSFFDTKYRMPLLTEKFRHVSAKDILDKKELGFKEKSIYIIGDANTDSKVMGSNDILANEIFTLLRSIHE